MKLYLVLLLVLIITVNARHSAKTEKKKSKNGTNSTGPKPTTGIAQVPPVKVIPFGPAAKNVDPMINSIGEVVSKNVTLTQFPFAVSRCDQIVLFPCQYINDEDDYRVRRNGYVSITAHYTNLYAAQDGQKLIEQVLATSMGYVPQQLMGARGCIKVVGDPTQKNLNICVDSLTKAKNLLDVYNQFSRCRMGDPLTEWDPDMIRELLKLCGISQQSVQQAKADEAQKQKDAEKGITRTTSVKMVNGQVNPKKDKSDKKKNMRSLPKKKKEDPKFFLPSEEDNEWEEDRMKYFQPSKLRVPGSRFKEVKSEAKTEAKAEVKK